jgi:thymidylate kinase/transcription elongation GreA/GreB family factor
MAASTNQARGAFIVVEGLIGVGKTTLVKELVKKLDLDLFSTPSEYQSAVSILENDPLALEARHALFFSEYCLAARKINDMLDNGQMVIVDSWVFRTQATHIALGSTLQLKIPAWFPQPDVKILLTCDEATRQQRIGERAHKSGFWKSKCEDYNEEILAWYRKNIKGLVEVDTSRDFDIVGLDLVSRVRPTIRRKEELLKNKVKVEAQQRLFLQSDLDALDVGIEQCKVLIKEAKEMGQEAAEQSSESWHDNYNFEESQRLLKMYMNNLGSLSNAREKAVLVSPAEEMTTASVGATVEFTVAGYDRTETVHIGSYLVGEENRAKGFMSYDAPRIAGLIGGAVGDTRQIQLDAGLTDVVIKSIRKSPLV